MKRFIEGEDRSQTTLMPECLDDYVGEDNTVRVVDAFVEQLDLRALRFEGTDPAVTGRPAYRPAVLLKIYLYGYLNRIQSSRRLQREALRNVELMWLTGRLSPHFKTIADTMALPFVAFVANSLCSVANSICSPRRGLPSTAANSKPSTIATATSPPPRCNGARRKSRRALS